MNNITNIVIKTPKASPPITPPTIAPVDAECWEPVAVELGIDVTFDERDGIDDSVSNEGVYVM